MHRNIIAILPPWPTYDVSPTHSFRLSVSFYIIYFAVPCTSFLDTSQFLFLALFPFLLLSKYTRYLVTIHVHTCCTNSATAQELLIQI